MKQLLLLLLCLLLPSAVMCQTDLGNEEVCEQIRQQYDDAKMAKVLEGDTLVFVQKGDHWGVLDKNGKALTVMVFEDFKVNSWGAPLLTIDGNTYMLCSSFKNGVAIVREVELSGLMDSNGLLRTPCRYGRIDSFEEGATKTYAEFATSQVIVCIDLRTGEETSPTY